MWPRWKPYLPLLAFIGLAISTVGILLRAWQDDHGRDNQGIKQNVLYSKYGGASRSSSKIITLLNFWAGHDTGNSLIDNYGAPGHSLLAGGLGRGVLTNEADLERVESVMNEFRVNTLVSDIIPLNRVVPDSRIEGCAGLSYPKSLPKASIIIPFYNEWPSLLLRTVYSIINRSPRHLLHEIILVDDASTLDLLKVPLEEYIKANFPKRLITLLRMPARKGLIYARMHGVSQATGDILIFFDSHMEVNIDWLQPLLWQVSTDPHSVAMATLDYIDAKTFQYSYNVNYYNRYGWSWSMLFFETNLGIEQAEEKLTNPRPGPTMVGSGFAIDREYFHTLGGYDAEMSVWGGENLEMSWRVWLCGGRIIHVPCSRIGHVPRQQPYEFPGGREKIQLFNYERAIRVWMGNYSRYVHNIYPEMLDLDAGDLTERFAIKSGLKCKDFKWYIEHVWPELNIYDEDVQHWGRVVNKATNLCLDNADYLFMTRENLYLKPCTGKLHIQGFSLKRNGQLRTTLQCVVPFGPRSIANVLLVDCLIGPVATWYYTKNLHLIHTESGQCLDILNDEVVIAPCVPDKDSQKWTFNKFHFLA